MKYNNYLIYFPISKKGDACAYVPKELHDAQKQAILKIPKDILNDWDNWVSKELGITKDELWIFFSAEQIDSIGLNILNFNKNKNFIIADETGIGKGRILSGICRWAFNHGKKILFFTEREHLFTDFWRDLEDTETAKLLTNPVVFHGSATIYNPKGEKILKGSIKNVQKIESDGFSKETNMVFSTYSQVSLKNHKKTKKDSLVSYCKDTVIILDECHNAAGDSNTKKFLLELFDFCSHITFSSATYIKDETQLDLYYSSIDFDAPTLDLMKKLLASDQDFILRKIFTYELTRNLQFWRREHEPLEVGWNTIQCQNEETINNYINTYSDIINGIFSLVNNLSKEPELSHYDFANNWFSLGSTINRLSRNLLLLMKIDTLVDAVKMTLNSNRKPVIVLDSTFSSLIKKVISHQSVSHIDDDDTAEEIDTENEEQTYELNFKKVLHYLIDEIAGAIIKENEYVISNNIILQYKSLLDKSDIFSDLSISPIDIIIDKLKQLNISCGEISGRNFKVVNNNRIEKIIKQPKSKLVSAFNSGDLDAMVITRAGASGISLHAGALFKDQRQRELYELEITSRPTYRLQFIGRVNRKNQVSKPMFSTVITNLPFEQRILNIERHKLKTLQSHISGDDKKMDQENIYQFYTDYCNRCAYAYLINNPKTAYQMGINLKNDKEEFYFIDSILKRCIVLSVAQQNFIYDFLIYCTQIENQLNQCQNNPITVQMEDIKTFWDERTLTEKEEFKTIYSKFPEKTINQFKFNWVGLMRATSTYKTDPVYEHKLKLELQNNINQYEPFKNYFSLCFQHQFLHNKTYDKNYLQEVIKPKIGKIKLGSQIIIKNFDGNIYGYINNITWPKIPDSWKYENLGLIEIVTINPHLDDRIYYAPSKYYLTVEDFFITENITIYEHEIDWQKFNRPAKEFNRLDHFFVGHPIYMEFLHQSYGIGSVKYYHIGAKNNMCIMLPPSLKREAISQLKKPIYSPTKIMDGLINKKFSKLSTTWQPADKIKAAFKLEHTTGGYNLFIACEIMSDFTVIDYPLRKKLTSPRGKINDYQLFLIPYKDIRTILFMLEKRDIIWFIIE